MIIHRSKMKQLEIQISLAKVIVFLFNYKLNWRIKFYNLAPQHILQI